MSGKYPTGFEVSEPHGVGVSSPCSISVAKRSVRDGTYFTEADTSQYPTIDTDGMGIGAVTPGCMGDILPKGPVVITVPMKRRR